MAVLIDLTHVRRARKLFGILLERYGITWFLQGGAEKSFRIDPDRLQHAVDLCAEWAARRTGTQVTPETHQLLHSDLKRLLIQRVAQGMVNAGY